MGTMNPKLRSRVWLPDEDLCVLVFEDDREFQIRLDASYMRSDHVVAQLRFLAQRIEEAYQPQPLETMDMFDAGEEGGSTGSGQNITPPPIAFQNEA